MILSLTEEQKIDSLLENIVPISNSLFSAIQNIPIVYNESENYGLVKYNDLDNLNTQYYSDINNSINLIAESNGIDPNSIFICVNESDLIEFPEIVNELSDVNYVVDPIPMDNPTVQLCDYLVEEALETGDESCLDVLEEADYEYLNEIFNHLDKKEKKAIRRKLNTHYKGNVSGATIRRIKTINPEIAAERNRERRDLIKNAISKNISIRNSRLPVVIPQQSPKSISNPQPSSSSSNKKTFDLKSAPQVSFFNKKLSNIPYPLRPKSSPKEAPKGGSTPQSRSAAYFYTLNNLHKNERPGVGEIAKRVFSLSKNKIKQADIPDKVGNAAYVGYKNAKEKLPIAKAKASQLAGQAKAMAGKGVGLAGKFASQGKGLLGNLKPKNFSSKLKNGAIDAGILAGGALLYKNRNSIINRIKGLRAKSDQLEKRMQSAPAPQKGIFRRIIDKIKSIIQKLMNKLRGR